MRIKYQFATGEKTEVEVPEAVGEVIMSSRRAEHAQQEKERYHGCSLDALDYEGLELADENSPDKLLLEYEESRRLYQALSSLSETQRRRLLLLANGLSIREIAAKEHADYKSVYESIQAARKNFSRKF